MPIGTKHLQPSVPLGLEPAPGRWAVTWTAPFNPCDTGRPPDVLSSSSTRPRDRPDLRAGAHLALAVSSQKRVAKRHRKVCATAAEEPDDL